MHAAWIALQTQVASNLFSRSFTLSICLFGYTDPESGEFHFLESEIGRRDMAGFFRFVMRQHRADALLSIYSVEHFTHARWQALASAAGQAKLSIRDYLKFDIYYFWCHAFHVQRSVANGKSAEWKQQFEYLIASETCGCVVGSKKLFTGRVSCCQKYGVAHWISKDTQCRRLFDVFPSKRKM